MNFISIDKTERVLIWTFCQLRGCQQEAVEKWLEKAVRRSGKAGYVKNPPVITILFILAIIISGIVFYVDSLATIRDDFSVQVISLLGTAVFTSASFLFFLIWQIGRLIDFWDGINRYRNHLNTLSKGNIRRMAPQEHSVPSEGAVARAKPSPNPDSVEEPSTNKVTY